MFCTSQIIRKKENCCFTLKRNLLGNSKIHWRFPISSLSQNAHCKFAPASLLSLKAYYRHLRKRKDVKTSIANPKTNISLGMAERTKIFWYRVPRVVGSHIFRSHPPKAIERRAAGEGWEQRTARRTERSTPQQGRATEDAPTAAASLPARQQSFARCTTPRKSQPPYLPRFQREPHSSPTRGFLPSTSGVDALPHKRGGSPRQSREPWQPGLARSHFQVAFLFAPWQRSEMAPSGRP